MSARDVVFLFRTMVNCPYCYQRFNPYNPTDSLKHAHEIQNGSNSSEAECKNCNRFYDSTNIELVKMHENEKFCESCDRYYDGLDTISVNFHRHLDFTTVKNKTKSNETKQICPYSIDNIPDKLTKEEIQRYSSMDPRPNWWKIWLHRENKKNQEYKRRNLERKQQKQEEKVNNVTEIIKFDMRLNYKIAANYLERTNT